MSRACTDGGLTGRVLLLLAVLVERVVEDTGLPEAMGEDGERGEARVGIKPETRGN